MQLHLSYDEAFQAAMADQSFAMAHLQEIKLPMNIDTSGCYKLFYFLSGAKKFHIGHMVYDVQPGDLYFVDPCEWHYFSGLKEYSNHERFVLFIYPGFLKKLSTDLTDLSSCFQQTADRPEHRIHLLPKESNKLLHSLYKWKSDTGFGEDLMSLSMFLEFMIVVNRLRAGQSQETENHTEPELTGADLTQSSRIAPILSYLDNHITEELSLELLSERFFLSPSYLCRAFKKDTGVTIHKYITARRITLAKELLLKGHSVTEACTGSGFKDYNGFLKSFVHAVGVSPKKYARLLE